MSVYFIRVGRYFKIGYSDDAQRRFENLHKSGTRYTFPVDASIALNDRELVRVVEGSDQDEAAIHLALDDYAVGLEWFLDEPPVCEFIEHLPQTVDDFRHDLPKLARLGGWCEDEYHAVQHGRACRELERYQRSRTRQLARQDAA